MHVSHIQVSKSSSKTVISATISFEKPYGSITQQRVFRIKRMIYKGLYFWNKNTLQFKDSKTVWFSLPSNKTSNRLSIQDAFFILSFGMAKFLHEDLKFEDAISEAISQKIPQLLSYFTYGGDAFVPHCEFMKSKSRKELRKGKAQFFTLGVDSFYTHLIPNQGDNKFQKKSLVYVNGFDVPLNETVLLQKIYENISCVARHSHSSTVFVSSNLRSITDQIIGWGQLHVAALASVGYMLSFEHILISGESFNFQDWGLREGADQLFTTKSIHFELYAHNMSRYQKLFELSKSKFFYLVKRYLRVCWQNVTFKDVLYNCSHCQKCLKTKLIFMSLNIVDTPTFQPVNILSLQKAWLPVHVREEWVELYEKLKENQLIDAKITIAVGKLLRKYQALKNT